MAIKFSIFILLFILSYEENEIIRIPYFAKDEEIISTKLGYIYYKEKMIEPLYEYKTCYVVDYQYLAQYYSNSTQKFINLTYLGRKALTSVVIMKKNYRIEFYQMLCNTLFEEKYINKSIISIGPDENNEAFVFFGGMPQNLIENHQKYIFKSYYSHNISNINISDMNFVFNDGKEINIKLNDLNVSNNNRTIFQIREDKSGMIILPKKIYESFFKEYEDYLELSKNKKYLKNNYFLSFKIGDKLINIKYDGDIYKLISRSYTELLMPEKDFMLGNDFLELFDYREYNFIRKEFIGYLKKDKNYTIEINEINKNIIIKSDVKFDFILLFVFIMLSIIAFVKNYHKYKNIEYYNYYYNI